MTLIHFGSQDPNKRTIAGCWRARQTGRVPDYTILARAVRSADQARDA